MRPLSATCAALALLPSLALGQGASPGFQDAALAFSPPLFSASATLSGGDVLVFDGVTVDRYDAAGLFQESYLTLPGFTFASFVAVSPDETFALVGESSNGELHRIDLVLGGSSLLATVAFNYDATIDPAGGVAWVSAASAVPGSNDLVEVDLGSGATAVKVTVPGFSGPVALEANGDLLLGISDSPNRVVRFTAAQLAGGGPLAEGDGELVTTGWSGISYLLSEPESGAVLVVENDFVTFTQPTILARAGADPASSSALYTAGPGISLGKPQLFVDTGDPQRFVAFQPQTGGRAVFSTTDFFSSNDRVEVRPKRATASVSGPGVGQFTQGLVTYTVHDALPGGIVALYFGLSATFDPMETAYTVSPWPDPLFWGLDASTHAFIAFPFLVDANGEASFTYYDPGIIGGDVAMQAALGDEDFNLIGTATGAVL